LVLCGGAAPAAYWEALRSYRENAVLVHFPDDRLCIIDVKAYSRLPLPRLVPVVVPHNAMAWHLLGPSHHNYMEHCVHPDTICPVKDIPRDFTVTHVTRVPRHPGECMERLCRLGMTARMQEACFGDGENFFDRAPDVEDLNQLLGPIVERAKSGLDLYAAFSFQLSSVLARLMRCLGQRAALVLYSRDAKLELPELRVAENDSALLFQEADFGAAEEWFLEAARLDALTARSGAALGAASQSTVPPTMSGL